MTNIETEILNKYNEGCHSTKLSKLYNKSVGTIIGIIKKQGGKIRSFSESHRKYTFNENYFEKINSEDKSYWLGFILADGCIVKNTINISLKINDINHLKNFLKCINSNSPCKEYSVKVKNKIYHCCKISLSSPKTVNDLYKLGITERKSLTCKVPNDIPSHLLKHFWRGVVDGDGSVTTCILKNRKTPDLRISLVGSLDIITSFKNFINFNANTTTNIKKEKSIYRVCCSGNSAFDICSILYNNSNFYLDRKKERFDFYKIQFGRPRKRKLYNFTKELLLKEYENCNRSWRKVCKNVKISRSGLRNIRKKLKL